MIIFTLINKSIIKNNLLKINLKEIFINIYKHYILISSNFCSIIKVLILLLCKNEAKLK